MSLATRLVPRPVLSFFVLYAVKWRDLVVPVPNSLFSPADRSKASKAGVVFFRAPTWAR
jgi:hypothetical protein